MDRGSTGSRGIVNSQGDGDNRNSSPGRARISRQTIAQGRPGVFRPTCCPVVHLRVQIFAQRTMGASRHPVFPAPSSPKRGKDYSKTRAFPAARMLMHACAENGMVLPDRIELSTSPLPMECSTTELRQQMLVKNRPPRGAYQAGRYLPQASPLCKLAGSAKLTKSPPLRAEISDFAPKPPVLA